MKFFVIHNRNKIFETNLLILDVKDKCQCNAIGWGLNSATVPCQPLPHHTSHYSNNSLCRLHCHPHDPIPIPIPAPTLTLLPFEQRTEKPSTSPSPHSPTNPLCCLHFELTNSLSTLSSKKQRNFFTTWQWHFPHSSSSSHYFFHIYNPQFLNPRSLDLLYHFSWPLKPL